MSDTPTASGADLARQALAAARANAKNTPAQGPKKPRRTIRATRGEGRDPQGLGSVLGKLTAEQGWEDQLGGGDILSRWNDLCPAVYAPHTRPTGYDPDTGTLTVRADSHTVAAGLRLAHLSLVKTINDKLGRTVVRQIRATIGTDGARAPELGEQVPDLRPAAEAPVRTRADGCPGYQAALAAALDNKLEKQPTNPYIVEAIQRQEAALRAKRQPETEHRDAVWAQDDAETAAGPASGSVEESLRRARAYARQQRAGQAPRRAFDAA